MLTEAADAESGFSLVELLVVILILGVVGGYTLTGLVRGMQTTDRVEARVQTFTDLQRASERVSRDLRRAVWTDTAAALTATPPTGCTFVDLNPADLTVIVFTDGSRFRHRYMLSGDELVLDRDVWSVGTSSWTDFSETTVITGLANVTSGVDLFGYLDASGTDLLDNGFDVTDRRAVRKFRLTLMGEVRDQGPVEVVTVVTARNGGLPCPVA